MNIPILLPALFEQIEQGHQVITVNQRLCDSLRRAYGQWRIQEQTSPVFASTLIQSLTQWLQQQWQDVQYQHEAPPVLLTEHQEHALWLRCLQEDPESEVLISFDQVVTKVQQAWEWVQHWQLPVMDWAHHPVDDVRAFSRWAKAFQQFCTANHCLSRAELPKWLLQHAMPVSQPYTWVGFVDHPPVITQLFSACQVSKVDLHHHKAGQSSELFIADSAKHERNAALDWAQQKLRENPSQLIQIVVPRLLSERAQWVKLAQDQLDSQGIRYNISGGERLSDQPVVQALLLILQSKVSRDTQVIQQFLHCPYLEGGQEEQTVRHAMSAELPKSATPVWGLVDLKEWLEGQDCAPGLQKVVSALLSNKWPSIAHLSSWLQHFEVTLHQAGWPGEQSLDSLEFQAIEHVKEALMQCQHVGLVVSERISASEAIQYLSRLLAATLFQAQSPAYTQIEILGALESVGMLSDHSWVCQLNADTFPAIPEPNPFIPLRIQQQAQLPHANAQRELHFAVEQMRQWKQQATTCIVSFAEQENGQPISASPLLAEVSPTTEQFGLGPTLPIPEWEYVNDNTPPEVSQQEIQSMKGGSGIFKAQAQCPFQATSRYRWGIEALVEVPMYWGPRERGIVIHEALEKIWQVLKDHAGLVSAMENDSLNASVEQIVGAVLSRWASRLGYWLTPVLLRAECVRISQLMMDWLQLEAKRQPFKVMAKEQKVIGNIGRLPIHMQVDRIDILPSGERVVIDYKTAKVSYRAWLTDRPTDPQLPLYAVMTHADGIAYACVRSHALQFSGVAAFNAQLPGVKSISEQTEFVQNTWHGQLDNWSSVLTRLAHDYCAGSAQVDPMDENACQLCEYQRLCRVGAHHD